MIRTLALMLAVATITPAAARPSEDLRYGRAPIIHWTDKSKTVADVEAGIPDNEVRAFEDAYDLIPNSQKHSSDPKTK